MAEEETNLVHLNLPKKLIARIDKIADVERRTRTDQIILLIEKGLQ